MLDILNSWQVHALAMSFFMAAYLLVNQHLRLPPRLLMIWRGFGQFALFLPIALYLGMPSSPSFYLFAFLTGLAISVLDRGTFQAALDFGAGTISRLYSLSMPLTFLLWAGLHPATLAAVLQGASAWLVPVAMGIILISILFVRRDPVSRGALLKLAPLIALGSLTDVLAKTTFTYGSGAGGFTSYAVVAGLTAGMVNLIWADHHHPSKLLGALIAPRMVRGGLMVLALVAMFLMTKTPALASAPNPGLVTAIGLLAPVWVVIWNYWHKVPDNSNLWAGLGCVGGALLLILSTL